MVILSASALALACGGGTASSADPRAGAPIRTVPINGSFEVGLAGWRGLSARLALVRGAASGRLAARISLKGAPHVFAIDRRRAPQARSGALYTAGAWVRSRRSGRRVCLRLEVLSPGSAGAEQTCLRSSRGWRRLGLAHRPEGGGRLAISVSMSGARPRDTFDVDGIVLRERSGDTESSVPGVTLWSADHESGDLSQWSSDDGGGEYNSGTADAIVSTRLPHSGRYSAAMTIATPPESGTRLFRYRESRRGSAAYYGAWYLIPRKYVIDHYWNLLQFKSTSADGRRNDPFWVLNVGNRSRGSMFLYLYDWIDRRGYVQGIKDLPVNQWVHIEVFLEQAENRRGRLVVWQDGVQLFDLRNIVTKFAGGDQLWSVNNYSDGIRPSPATIFIDDALISSEPSQ